jgi:hypothetical protein
MSRTLRRPMFRGGSVNSYNTGITSGLGEEGYADGGRVALGLGGWLMNKIGRGTAPTTVVSTAPKYEVAGPGMSMMEGTQLYKPTMSYSDLLGISDLYKSVNPYLANPFIAAPVLGYGAYEIGRLPGRITDSGYLVPGGEEEKFIKDFGGEILGKETSTGEAIEGYYLSKNLKRAEDLKKRGLPGDKETADKLIASSTPQITGPSGTKESELDKLKKYYEDQLRLRDEQYKKRIEGLTKTTEDEDITRQTELYQKLLGGEEAKSQAVYDALLAASPAFFKGKNLREAAPEVLTAINKSGAFDKPRDIRQAAAQLAIQRNILKEKAVAEEKARLAALTLKGQKDIFDILEKQPGGLGSYGGNLEKAVSEGSVVDQRYYKDNLGRLVRAEQDKKTKKFRFIELE